jgi:outer membrane lipoprotein-sorting protein
MKRRVLLQLVGILAVLTLGALVNADEPSTTPPFTLTAEEQKEVDAILDRWEKWNAQVKTFDCRFKRWVYDSVFGTLDRPMFEEWGRIQYASPDKLLFQMEESEKDGKRTPIEDSRTDHWLFDGKTIWEYNPLKMQVIEHKLPLEMRKRRIVDGPLSFAFPSAALSSFFALFGSSPDVVLLPLSSSSDELKRQYYFRNITPPGAKDQIWLEAYPKSQRRAGNCRKLELIFMEHDMSPFALMLVQPNGKDYVAYQFYDIKMNAPSPPGSESEFQPRIPPGWEKVADSP